MKTLEDVYKEVAAEMNLPLDTVTETNETWWKLIRSTLSEGNYLGVRIAFLGAFYTTPAKLLRRISYYLMALQRIRAGMVTPYKVHLINQEAREIFPRLWKLKQILQFRLTPGAKPLKRIPRGK